MSIKKVVYLSGLVVLTAGMWVPMYTAQFMEYDDNFGQLIVVFLMSVAILTTGVVLILRKVKLIMTNLVATLLFLIINSPLTVILVATNYEMIFGAILKL